MLNLNATLDNLIAMVVVLLALSLVVQAVQSAVKKMFKLKSRQIEDSLAHLFQYVINDKTSAQMQHPDESKTDPPRANKGSGFKALIARLPFLHRADKKTPVDDKTSAQAQPDKGKSGLLWANKWKGYKAMIAQSPFLRVILRWRHPADNDSFKEAAVLYNEVLNQFRGIGRTALSTRPIFDSMSKGDLMKVVGSITPSKLDSNFTDNVGKAMTAFNNLLDVFRQWSSWFASANLNVGTYLNDDDRAKLAELQAKFKPLLSDLGLLAADVSNGETLGKVVAKFAEDLAGLRAVKFDDAQKVLDDVRANVRHAAERARLDKQDGPAQALDALGAELDKLAAGFAVFRQTYAAVFARWVKLEESFDTVMQSFEERYTRSMKTAAIVISFAVVLILNANFFNVYKQISTSDAERELIIQSRPEVLRALAAHNQADGQTQTSDAAAEQTVESWFKASQTEIDKNAHIFIGYGFSPIGWQNFENWYQRWQHNKRQGFAHDVRMVIGWLVMALLLSVGAPFWQDFLESLFGVKNVLRKQSGTKNVEQESGSGQPRQS